MKIIIRMKCTKNMLINDAFLGYIPSAIDSHSIVDYEYNLLVHLPRKFATEDAQKCVNDLQHIIPELYPELDYTTVKLIKHKPYDEAYFHHMSTKEVEVIGPRSLAYYIYSRHIIGCFKTKNLHGNYTDPINPYEVFKPI